MKKAEYKKTIANLNDLVERLEDEKMEIAQSMQAKISFLENKIVLITQSRDFMQNKNFQFANEIYDLKEQLNNQTRQA